MLKSKPRSKSKPTNTKQRRQYRRKSFISRRRRRDPTINIFPHQKTLEIMGIGGDT